MRYENSRTHNRGGQKSGGPKKRSSHGEKRPAPPIPDFDLSNPNPELFSKTALHLAEAFSEDVYKGKKNKDLNKSSQLRKFYDELVELVEQVEQVKQVKQVKQGEELRNGAAVEVVLPRVKMLQAKAAYSYGRKLVGEAFVNFISRAVDMVNDREGIKHFKMLFEAIIGFRKGLEEGLNIGGKES